MRISNVWLATSRLFNCQCRVCGIKLSARASVATASQPGTEVSIRKANADTCVVWRIRLSCPPPVEERPQRSAADCCTRGHRRSTAATGSGRHLYVDATRSIPANPASASTAPKAMAIPPTILPLRPVSVWFFENAIPLGVKPLIPRLTMATPIVATMMLIGTLTP